MKKTLIPLVIIHYAFLILTILLGAVKDEAISEGFAWALLILVPFGILSALLNAINAFRHRNESLNDIVKPIMIVKLLMIPYYLVSFLYGVIFLLLGVLSIITIFWLASLPLVLVSFLMLAYNYLIMLSTGTPIIFRLIKQYKNYNLITCIVIVITQLIMVVDVVGSIFLYIQTKEKNKNIINVKEENIEN